MNRNEQLKKDALDIINTAIRAADPFDSTAAILRRLKLDPDKRLTVFSVGKAAIPMARAAESVLGGRIAKGLAVTKYGHTGDFRSDIFEVIEAAHPVSDGNSILAAQTALDIACSLGAGEILLVLLSGGGSALFEKSVIPAEMQRDITRRLLARGADISDVNAVRRRLSLVKGGRLAAAAYPARVVTVALSDVLGNDRSVIASGITVREPLSSEKFTDTVKKYLPEYAETLASLDGGTDIMINDGGYYFAGDVEILCSAARRRAEELGCEVADFACDITGEARDVAAEKLDNLGNIKGKRAYIYGGETTVTLRGGGRGGRNQEMALAAAIRLRGRDNIVFASAGSDGTDGPTDAAGGIADGDTYELMRSRGVDPEAELLDNNSYFALDAADSLIVTGPTGTNVNDITLILTDF